MVLSQANVFYRFVCLFLLSLILMITDHRSDVLQPLRIIASVVLHPFQVIAEIPTRLEQSMQRFYPDDTLHQRYEELRTAHLQQQVKIQRLQSLEDENTRLRRLLSVVRSSEVEVVLSRILQIDNLAYRNRVMIDKGVTDGVYQGQPAIGPDGIIGQVSEPGLYSSVVTLITDPQHGLPVQIQRNGVSTIAVGLGEDDVLSLPFLAPLADVRQGDVLVTSGLGGRFPIGYQVGRISEVIKDANEPFLQIRAETFTPFDSIKEVLLLWFDEQVSELEDFSDPRGESQR